MSSSSSGPSRQQQLHEQLHHTRLQIQQHQQQLYGLLPPPSELGHNVSSYSPTSGPLPPIPSPHHHAQRIQQGHYFADHHGSSAQQQPNNAWRTSNSRDEPLIPLLHHPPPQPKHPPPQIQSHPLPQPPPRLAPAPSQPVKRETAMPDKPGPSSHRSSEDPMPSTSDFVKKLYKMLEDPSFQSVVSWGPQGDCFVVKDMNEFTKSILPRMFKHSNFASFVRQLNKYDFHKVKNTDDNQFGEHSWTFRHPDFHADRRDALENIKRKVPAQRKSATAAAAAGAATSSGTHGSAPYPPSSIPGSHSGRRSPSPGTHQQLLAEIQSLKEEGDDLKARIRSLERNYESVLVEMVGFQRGMAQQDGLMQSLIAYFLGSESGKPRGANTGTVGGGPGPSLVPTSSSSSTTATATTSGHPQHHASRSVQAQPSTPAGLPQHPPHHHARSLSSSHQQQPSTPTGPLPPAQQLQQHLAAQRDQQARALGPLSAGGTDPNPFLPQHAMERLVGGAYFTGGQPSSSSQQPQSQPQSLHGQQQPPIYGPTPPDLGRATLMQMNEFSRRAGGYLKQQQQRSTDAGGGNLWTGMNYNGVDGDSDPRQSQPQQQQQPKSKAEWLAQLREYQKERWGAPPPLPSSSSSRGRSVSADRTGYVDEYGSASVSMDDDAMRGRNRERRRMSEGGGAGLVDKYSVSVQRQQEEQARQAGLGSAGSSSSNNPSASDSSNNNGFRPPTPATLNSMDAWAQMMSNTSQQFNFNAYSGASGAGGDEDSAAGHEGLQVYTVGHLMPRDFVDNAQGDWAIDPGSLLPLPQQQPSQPQQQQTADGDGADGDEGSTNSGDGETDEDEVVRPTPTNPPTTGGIVDPSSSGLASGSSPSSSSSPSSAPTEIITPGAQKLRVRRSTFVPGWAVPPRVLLVDDDAVSRKLSTKFLKVFGCTTDVAVDGVGAVNKMNLEKYDLVLMDIVMPKLDGVSATNLIRKFDQGTPIISMTSNSKPNEIMTYYSSGMNDILPKPFTKDGLLDMLEKHLTHLKVISQLQRVPPQMGILPPLNDAGFEQALTAGANQLALGTSQPQTRLLPPPSSSQSQSQSQFLASSSSSSSQQVANAPSPFNFNFLNQGGNGVEDDGRINPLAGMGLTDEQYNLILQNIVSGEGFMGIGGVENGPSNGQNVMGGGGGGEKRPLEDPVLDDRDGKRGRFENTD